METSNQHWIENVTESETSRDMITIVLSTAQHAACIEIHGSRIKATNKAVIILQALNKE